FTGKRFASGLRLGCDLSPIESASSKCCHQNEYRRNDGCHCTFDFKWDHHGTLPPLRSSSPPKYPAAATNPEANSIKTRYRRSPVRDIASLTTSLHTAKATR